MSLELSLVLEFPSPSPLGVCGSQNLVFGKRVWHTSFGGLVTVWAQTKGKAIIRSFRPRLSLVENWQEGDRATQATTRPAIVITS